METFQLRDYAKFAESMEHNVGICKKTQCETTVNQIVLTSVYGPLSSVDLGVVCLHLCAYLLEMGVEIDMLTGGAFVLGWLATRHRIGGCIGIGLCLA